MCMNPSFRCFSTSLAHTSATQNFSIPTAFGKETNDNPALLFNNPPLFKIRMGYFETLGADYFVSSKPTRAPSALLASLLTA